ncbi:hypothetical protein H9X96_22000 [Pedobacter sp. N36a]|uniref:ABC-three component system middle component 1 n=1 Tax=Pedobacter sp. N36a TaxID=2767996 RepID=UPI00165705DA|nr:ABC-three component system middle component 1 [Pedobacter sp. N36a]MBC8988433.1 hypothetical protein [Pedobacter sp. N36a]
MQLVNSHQTLDDLSKFDDFFKKPGIQCWQTPSGNINLHLFSIIFETVQDLQEHYKELRDHVAISFQSRTLQNGGERWNLYLLYLVKEQVPEEIKQIILQDKFSARKMVCYTGDNEINDDYVMALIGKTLIDIEIPEREASSDRLEQLIKTDHPQVAAARRTIGLMSNRDNLQTLINLLINEQN